MCYVYSSTNPQRYESSTRSVRLQGFVTSVRLENEFWGVLELLADDQNLTVPQFICELHDEVLAEQGQVHNLASLLRVACALYLRGRQQPGGGCGVNGGAGDFPKPTQAAGKSGAPHAASAEGEGCTPALSHQALKTSASSTQTTLRLTS